MEWLFGDFVFDDDKRKTDAKSVHELLKDTYWATGRPIETVQKTIANSQGYYSVAPSGRQSRGLSGALPPNKARDCHTCTACGACVPREQWAE